MDNIYYYKYYFNLCLSFRELNHIYFFNGLHFFRAPILSVLYHHGCTKLYALFEITYLNQVFMCIGDLQHAEGMYDE